MILRKNNNYSPKDNYLVGFWNGEKRFLQDTNWIFKHYLEEYQAQKD